MASSLPDGYSCDVPPGDCWCLWQPPGARPLPPQGWKLHISADAATLAEVLVRIAPILCAFSATFKHAISPDALRDLNEGVFGLTQIGKAVTVYCGESIGPPAMVAALDAATQGFDAPRVRFEPCFGGKGNVHARYGGFQGMRFRTPLGAIEPAILDADGRLVADNRQRVEDSPVLAKAGFRHRSGPPPLVAGRYALVQRVFETPRGDILFAIDVSALTRCIAKTAFRGDGPAPDGRDSLQRLEAEADVLKTAGATSCCPGFLAFERFPGGAVLVMEHLAGQDLVAWMHARPFTGSPAELRHRTALFDRICRTLEELGTAGIRPLDLSARDIRVGPAGAIRLLDLEHAELHGRALAVPPHGTQGYAKPAENPADPETYALSAILYMLLGGVEPSRHPAPEALKSLPLHDLNPAVPEAMAAAVAAGLSGEIRDRAELRRSVSRAASGSARASVRPRAPEPDPRPDIDDRLRGWIDSRDPDRQADEDRCAYSGLTGVASYALAAGYDTDRLAWLARSGGSPTAFAGASRPACWRWRARPRAACSRQPPQGCRSCRECVPHRSERTCADATLAGPDERTRRPAGAGDADAPAYGPSSLRR